MSRFRIKFFSVLASFALIISATTIPALAKTLDELRAESNAYAAQIAAKKAQIAELEKELGRISGEVASYQTAIAAINYEIQILDGRIAIIQAEYDALEVQIEELNIKIENNKDALGLTLRELYNTKNISLIERLASSQSLSSFIDKEAQLDNISEELTKTVNQIELDKSALEVKQLEAEQKLADLATQKSEQARQRSAQQHLLNLSRQEQNEYGAKKRAADQQRADLEAAQRDILRQIAISTGAGDPNKGNYKYSRECPSSGRVDEWGMYKCQCVSYTAWKVHEQWKLGRARFDMPVWGGNWQGGLQGGNASQWYNNAGVAGIPRGTTPKVNSVGVLPGNPGHVVWVEAIGEGARAGQIYVSEYNGQRDRDYSETWYPLYYSNGTRRFTGFVYFNER